MRTAIGAAIIENNKLLLVRKRQSWIIPGGKPNPGESDIECLCREVREELSGTQLDNIQYYGDFEEKTPHAGDILRAKTYFANINGVLFKPTAEISDYDWAKDPRQYNLSDITTKIVDTLTRDGYLRHPSD